MVEGEMVVVVDETMVVDGCVGDETMDGTAVFIDGREVVDDGADVEPGSWLNLTLGSP